MEKLTGHGRPGAHFRGEVGQHYEDLDTGDIYECRVANQWSALHGKPLGGYVWERRAKGEDIQELFGSGSGGSGGGSVVVTASFSELSYDTNNIGSGTTTEVDKTYEEMRAALDAGQNVLMIVDVSGYKCCLVPTKIDVNIVYFSCITGDHNRGTLTAGPNVMLTMFDNSNTVQFRSRPMFAQ